MINDSAHHTLIVDTIAQHTHSCSCTCQADSIPKEVAGPTRVCRAIREARALKKRKVIFLEVFAGKGRLSRAVRKAGGIVLPVEEYMHGGFDFRREEDVDN